MNLIKLTFVVTSAVAALAPRAHAQGGVPLWTNRYDGLANSGYNPVAVVVDGSGNVFVTGSSAGAYTTIEYSNTGLALWTNTYNAPATNNAATAIAVDGSGNVFVTGNSDISGFGTNNAYATIKYSSAGVPLWTNCYSASGSSNNYGNPNAIAVDQSGNVFVTGQSAGSTRSDYATIAYSGAGAPLWTNRYHGPGSANANDSASAIAVDGSGNVFVTGGSFGINSGEDYATIKYSSAGAPLWTTRYNGPGSGPDTANAIAADGSGNVFVTGQSYGISADYATLKYSSAGTLLWERRYDGPANDDDIAARIAVDNTGNVVVTGSSENQSGPYFYWEYATIKYSSAGVPLWTNRCHGPVFGSDYAHAMAVDSSGNVFVTGESAGSVGLDYATIAYSAAGVPLWTNRYHGLISGDNSASALAVDGSGNVIVTGHSWNGSSYGGATIKYSSSLPQPVLPPQLTIVPDGGGGYLINAKGSPNFACQLQRASALTGPWSTSVSQTADASGLIQFHDLFPPAASAFYRTLQQ